MFNLHIFDEHYVLSKTKDSSKCLILPRDLSLHHEIKMYSTDMDSIPLARARYMPFVAVVGIYTLLKGPYLAIVTKSVCIANGPNRDGEIHAVTGVELLYIPNTTLYTLTPEQQVQEEEYILMLKKALTTTSLVFAYDIDLTHTQQRTFYFVT